MLYNYLERERRRRRYDGGIWSFLSVAASAVFGFFFWLCGFLVGAGQELLIP
jgi:hypothetical protein